MLWNLGEQSYAIMAAGRTLLLAREKKSILRKVSIVISLIEPLYISIRLMAEVCELLNWFHTKELLDIGL